MTRRILVYVEGPADRAGMEALFAPLIAAGKARGLGVQFYAQRGKPRILGGVPRRAAVHLREHPDDWVLAVPDLYPMREYQGTENAHRNADELVSLLERRFADEAEEHGVPASARSKFRAFCFQYDVEVLLLAAPDLLRRRLKTRDQIEKRWCKPVEAQNDHRPPKRVIEALFKKYRRQGRYQDTSDLPWVLEKAALQDLEAACPQRFAPLAAFLRERVEEG